MHREGHVGAALLAFLAGMTVPTRYGLERLNGFGRWVAAKVPYRPPPGQKTEEAMVEAAGDDSPGDVDTDEQGDGAGSGTVPSATGN